MFAKETFENQIALVTGGRSGIGYAISKLLLQCGAKVMIISRQEELLKIAAAELSEFGDCSFMVCDIRKTESIIAVANRIKKEYGRLDILINNAGGQFPALAELISDNGWNAVIRNNLNGTFFMTREMANHFFIPQERGVIVNIIANIYRGFPGMIHTGAARAGVENMTKTLAVEWARFNIRINCVAPGIIESSGLEQYDEAIKKMFIEARKKILFRRFGTVEEVANVSCFLASPLASYTSGTTIYVDGAQHLDYNNVGFADTLRSMEEES